MSEVRLTSTTGGQKGQKEARFDLISWSFLWQLARVCGFGAKKYDDDNWRKGYSWRLSYGAMQRHLTQFWTGQLYDDESGIHHLAHAAWHCMVLFIFSVTGKYQQFDDRPDGMEPVMATAAPDEPPPAIPPQYRDDLFADLNRELSESILYGTD